MEEEYLTATEAAAALGVSESSVWQAMREKRLPNVTKYGRRVIARGDVEAYRARTQLDGKPPRGRPKGRGRQKTTP